MKAARACLLGLATALAFPAGCTCGGQSGHEEEAAAKRAAEQRAKERKAIKALADSLGPAPSPRRPPLVAAGQEPGDGDAFELYAEARTQALALLEGREVTLEAVAREARRWPAAPEPLRELGADAKAPEIADLVARGAARVDAAFPGDGQSSRAWTQTAAVVLAGALHRAAAGEPAEAAWSLLALARLGQDLARGAGPGEIQTAAEIVRAALAGLRAVVDGATAETLPADSLEALATACDSLRETMPGYADLLASDQRRRVTQLLALAQGDERAQEGDPLAAEVEAAGGALAYVEGEKKLRGLNKDLRAAADRKAHASVALLQEEAASFEGRRAEALSTDAFARWILARADLAATSLALALRHDLQNRRKLAPSLEALEKARGALPEDPIGRRPFDYVDDKLGGRILRSRPVELAGKAVAVEIPIPAPRRL